MQETSRRSGCANVDFGMLAIIADLVWQGTASRAACRNMQEVQAPSQ